MGGYGSGRTSCRQQADQCRWVDVNYLNRNGHLRLGSFGTLSWSRNGEEFGLISFRTQSDQVLLEYRVKAHGGDWESVSQTVPLTYVHCNYGAHRPYFRCPGVIDGRSCGRRVGKLFGADKYFLCRHCYRLNYTSQTMDLSSRLLERANKARKALGGEPGAASFIPPKPKWMHHRTYMRHRSQIESNESHASQLFLSKFAHHLSLEERQMYFGR